MESIVIDTDVVSFWFKDDTRIAKYRRHLFGKVLIVSFATLAELDEWAVRRRWGLQQRERMERHLQRFVFYPSDRHLCRLWAELRQLSRQRGRLLAHGDAWIAATAIACGSPLLTHNAADYEGLAGISVITEAD